MKNAKIAFVLVLALILILVKTTGFAQSENSLKQQFEKKISDLLGVPVKVGDYRLEYTTVHLSQIEIGKKDTGSGLSGQIGKLSASCDFMSLLGGNLVLNDIEIDGVSLELTRELKGSFFPEKPLGDVAEAKDRSFSDLPFLNLKGSKIDLKIRDKSQNRSITATLPNLKLTREKASDRLQLVFSGRLQTAELNAGNDATTDFSGDMVFKGKMAEPEINGKATISNLLVKHKILKQQVKLERGTFKINDKTIETSDLKGSWGRSKLAVTGQIKNFSQLNLDYRVNPIVLEEISKAFLLKNGVAFSGSGTTQGKITGSLNDYKFIGSLNWPAFTIEAPISGNNKSKFLFPFKNVNSNYEFNGKRIFFSNSQAQIFGGRLYGSGSIYSRTSPTSFDMNINGKNLRVEQFLGENSSQKNVVSGPVDADFSASGNASGLVSMNGQGNLTMKGGNYNAPPVVTPLLSMVNLKDFASGTIDSGKGSFKLSKGILLTDDLYFLTSAGKAYYRGQVGLDTTLQGKLNLMFSETAVRQSSALQQISLDGKSAAIPSRVEGTLIAPVFPGFSAEKLLELGLKRTGQKILIDILKPRREQPAESDSQETPKKDPGKQILKDLQKIFKF